MEKVEEEEPRYPLFLAAHLFYWGARYVSFGAIHLPLSSEVFSEECDRDKRILKAILA